MVPAKVIMLDSHVIATPAGPLTLKPGDVIAQTDFLDPLAYMAFCDEVVGKLSKATDYEAPSLKLQRAHDNVLALRLRGGAVEEGVTAAIMYRGTSGGVIPH